MKQNIFFSSLFVFSLLVSCAETKEVRREETKESNASIKIQEIGLEVMKTDLSKMTWDEAKKACGNLGDGWRLPTIDELKKIYKYKDFIGGFTKNYYWSSTEYDGRDALAFDFGSVDTYNSVKDYTNYVRAVRALK